MCTANNHE